MESVQVNKAHLLQRWNLKMLKKPGREADSRWLSHTQTFNTYILINRLNGCLVGANSTFLNVEQHQHLLVFYSPRLHSILLKVPCFTLFQCFS